MAPSYVEISIAADGELLDRLVALLSEVGVEGFWEDAGTLRCYLSERRWRPDLEPEITRLVALITRSSSSPAPAVAFRRIEDQNWNAQWEATIRPIRVTPRIIIAPSWHPVEPAPRDIVVTIDPKMSFGTGYHETTRLSLRLLERHLRPECCVLDIGTGTGVLAIAAIRLGARSAVGIDVDEWSFDNARENAALNGVADRLSVHLGELATVSGTFDLVLANIQRTVLEPLLPAISRRLREGGITVLSGLLAGDEGPMREALLRERFGILEVIRENEWIAMAADRNNRP